MSHRLVPCTGCSRHVRLSEPHCPFCGSGLPSEAELPPLVTPPQGRLSRAALFAFGAAAAGVVAVSGCGDDSSVPLYGAPADTGAAFDSGTPDASPDGAADAATDAAADAPADAAADSLAAAYGAPPSDGG